MPISMVPVGTIVKTHGIKGQVILQSFTRPHNLFFTYPLFSKMNKPLSVYKKGVISRNSEQFIVFISGSDSLETAKLWIGAMFYTKHKYISKTDRCYLIHLPVWIQNKEIGWIHSVENYGAGDLFVIHTQDNKEIIVPVQKPWIQDILYEENKILLHDLPD